MLPLGVKERRKNVQIYKILFVQILEDGEGRHFELDGRSIIWDDPDSVSYHI